MNRYRELRARQQAEFNALPLGWAFNQKQFDEMMLKWGLDPEKDTDKIYGFGGGGFVQKKDADEIRQSIDRLTAELQSEIDNDPTGEGFVYEMFLEELEDHEYSYTHDLTDTLDCLGYTLDDIDKNSKLRLGLAKAISVCEKSDS